MHIFIVVGLPASGKSVLAKALAKKFHAKYIATGDIVREEIKRRGLRYTPETDKKMRNWFHAGREHLIATRLWKKIKSSEIVFVDGFRSPLEKRVLVKISKTRPMVISVEASFEVRAKRLKARHRFSGAETNSYLRKRDRSELSFGLGKLMRNADFRINNNRLTEKQTTKRAEAILMKILRSQ